MRKLTLNGLLRANEKLNRASQLLAKIPSGGWTPEIANAQRWLATAHSVMQLHLNAALRERVIVEAAKQATTPVGE